MRGIVLAGGMGTRLRPMTLVTNKHLLPVYDRPMVYFPLLKLKEAGITDVMIITGPESAGDFLKLLASGKALGLNLTFRVQEEAGGIAQALGLCRDFAGKDNVCVILGDNIFEDDLGEAVRRFDSGSAGAHLFLKKVTDAKRFGVAEVAGERILSIEEKPKQPKSDLAVTGAYLYHNDVFEVVRSLKPSARGELEITDVNNHYVQSGRATFTVLSGRWSDAGTVESLFRASQIARDDVVSGKIKPLL